MKKIIFYDTTLRDGEQSPGFSMNPEEKLRFAHQLVALGVDVIEAGFPASSESDFDAVKKISLIKTCTGISALARAKESDISIAYNAVKSSENPILHIFLSSSDIHIEHQLKMKKDDVIELAEKSVKYAMNLCSNVQFSCMDSTRSGMDFLVRMIGTVISAGAKTVNLSDTVGFLLPDEMYNLVKYIKENVPDIEKVKLSVHCHNDLGCATANTLSAVKAGADQVECTVNGIGERGGIAALEEIAVAIKVKGDILGVSSNINLQEITATSLLLSEITGIDVQPNKAIVGANAFSHESGIHQDGVIKNPLTYELINPSMVGAGGRIVLGRHSGRMALRYFIAGLGLNIREDKFEEIFLAFKDLVQDEKKVNHDLVRIMIEKIIAV